MIVIFLLKVN